MVRIAFVLVLLCPGGLFKITNNVKVMTRIYERDLNSSIVQEKQDRELRSAWTVDLQVKRISVTTACRLQMSKHRDHYFQRTVPNGKWSECLNPHRRQMNSATLDYFRGEGDCLTASTAQDEARASAVHQLEKEIRKWRKGYRYLVNTCKAENPEDKKAAEVCLVQYMNRDYYERVVERLMVLKQEAMARLFQETADSLTQLEDCLTKEMSSFVDKTQQTIDILNKCYSSKANSN